MKSPWLMVLVALVCLMGTSVSAKDNPTVTPVAPGDLPVITSWPGTTDMVGNLNPATWRVTGYFAGAEMYKFLFNPVDQLDCPAGFMLSQVHIILEFDETMTYPVEFEAWADLEDALWDEAYGCWSPGIEDCQSEVFSFSIEEPGMYDIALPIDCACAYMTNPDDQPYWYLLGIMFPQPFAANLITDDFPEACNSWNDWGAGWFDLVGDFDFPGGLMMWGDVTCCTDPVEVEDKSWGNIKSLYR